MSDRNKLPLPPKPPRAWLPQAEERLQEAFRSSVPPAIKRHTTDRDIKASSDLVAVGEAFNRAQRATMDRFDALDAQVRAQREQVAAADGRVIALHTYVTRNPWLRSPVARILATLIGSALGAYAATKGLVP